tara:strand:+ start:350 stop:508 length:159 start_codon:yes stop_codon:yes gene_type:complete
MFLSDTCKEVTLSGPLAVDVSWDKVKGLIAEEEESHQEDDREIFWLPLEKIK